MEHIKIENESGTWYEIDTIVHCGQRLYLMESEQHGEDVPHIIIDGNNDIVLDCVFNGFDDYYESIK